jgi:CubicO group peptidase (beta-lactamase class C family)
MCSGLFVSRRSLPHLKAELDQLGIALFHAIETRVDTVHAEVVADVFGMMSRRARHREGQGCTLDPGRTPTPFSRRPVLALASLPPQDTLVSGGANLRRVLAAAFDEPGAEETRRTLAVVVVHDGHVVGERYARGIEPSTPLPGWSMAKSVMHALVGILVGAGRMDAEAPVQLDAWSAPGDSRQRITLRHLLQMSSGLAFDESASLRSDVLRMLLLEGDVGAFAASRPLAAPPGTRWSYASGSTNLIALAMKRAFASDSAYLEFPRRALFAPLGMSSAVLEVDAAGTFIASSYLYASARDWARFGALYLNDGLHEGQRVLPEGWVQQARSPAPADPTGAYGAHFWLRLTPDFARSNTPLPADAFHAIGHEGQFVSMVPSRRTVIVRLGRTRAAGGWDQSLFVRDVLSAIEADQAPH